MTTLTHRDWLRLHGVIVALHEALDLDAAARGLLAGLNELLPFDIGNVQDDSGGMRRIPWRRGARTIWEPPPADAPITGRRVMPEWGPDFLPLREAFFAVSAEHHPHTAYFRRTGDGTARRITEIVPMRRLRQTAFFHEISRPLGVAFQVTVYIALSSTQTLTCAAARGGGTDFSDRDRLVLDLLRPHLAAVWRRGRREEARLRCARQHLANPSGRFEIGRAVDFFTPLGLTRREVEVLCWMIDGKTNPEIALILEIGAGTVKTHVERILAKLNCETRTAAARTAFEILTN